jgi:hypothetical protein
MTLAIIGHRARQARRETATHLFALGQNVRLRGGFARLATPTDIYRVTGMLPPRGNSPQYRIRCDDERHERVMTQDDLEAVDLLHAAPSLIERTFGNG